MDFSVRLITRGSAREMCLIETFLQKRIGPVTSLLASWPIRNSLHVLSDIETRTHYGFSGPS